MSKPTTKTLWTNGSPDNRIEPNSSKKNTGFLSDERPGFQHFNWIIWILGEWINYLESRTDYDSTNFLKHGGFDNLSGWELETSNISVTTAQVDAVFGKKHGQMTTNTSVSATFEGIYQTIDFKDKNFIEGKTVTIGAFLKRYLTTGSHSAQIKTLFLDASNNILDTQIENTGAGGATNWTALYQTYTTPQNTQKIKIYFQAQYNEGIYIDSAFCVLGTLPKFGIQPNELPFTDSLTTNYLNFSKNILLENLSSLVSLWLKGATEANLNLHDDSRNSAEKNFNLSNKDGYLKIRRLADDLSQILKDNVMAIDKNGNIGVNSLPDSNAKFKVDGIQQTAFSGTHTANTIQYIKTLISGNLSDTGWGLGIKLILDSAQLGKFAGLAAYATQAWANGVGLKILTTDSGYTYNPMKISGMTVAMANLQDTVLTWGEKNSGNTLDYTMPANFVGLVIVYSTWGGNCGHWSRLYWVSSDYDVSSIYTSGYAGNSDRHNCTLVDGWGSFTLRINFTGYVYSGWLKLLPFSGGPALSN